MSTCIHRNRKWDSHTTDTRNNTREHHVTGQGLIVLVCRLWTWQSSGEQGHQQWLTAGVGDTVAGPCSKLGYHYYTDCTTVQIDWSSSIYTWLVNLIHKLCFRRGTETERRILETFGRQWLVCVCALARARMYTHVHMCLLTGEKAPMGDGFEPECSGKA